MTHTKDEALKLAIQSLESCSGVPHWPAICATIVTIKQALAAQPAPVQEPVGRVCFEGDEVVWTDEPPESGSLLYTTPPAAQPAVPEGWRVELADAVYGDVRLIAPNGEAWRFRNTDGVDEFAWRFLMAMLAAAPEKGNTP